MPKFNVGLKEVWEQMYSVSAESKEEAITKLKEYLADCSHEMDVNLLDEQFEYCNSLSEDNWNVYENKDVEYV